MPGFKNKDSAINKNFSANTMKTKKISKKFFTAALMVQENMRKLKKQNSIAEDEVKILERFGTAVGPVNAREPGRFKQIFNQKNMTEVVKHFAALAFIMVVIYIMYLVLDMAFGPKTYKLKNRM